MICIWSSRMVDVSVSVTLPLHHKVQKFSSGTGSPGWSRRKGRKTVVDCGVCLCYRVWDFCLGSVCMVLLFLLKVCVCAYATHYLLIGCNFMTLSQRAGIVKNSDADVCTVSLAYIFHSSVLLALVFPKDSLSAHQVWTWHNSVKEDWLN